MEKAGQKTVSGIVLALVLLLAGAMALYFFVVAPSVQPPLKTEPAAPEMTLVRLYFGHPSDAFLVAEPRALLLPADPSAKALKIMEALLEGPRQEGISVIPNGARLNSVFVDDKGICHVDFSREIRQNHPGGSAGEAMTIWSVVDTLVLNVDEIRSVNLLIEGQQEETLAGHLDIRRPLGPDLRLIK